MTSIDEFRAVNRSRTPPRQLRRRTVALVQHHADAGRLGDALHGGLDVSRRGRVRCATVRAASANPKACQRWTAAMSTSRAKVSSVSVTWAPPDRRAAARPRRHRPRRARGVGVLALGTLEQRGVRPAGATGADRRGAPDVPGGIAEGAPQQALAGVARSAGERVHRGDPHRDDGVVGGSQRVGQRGVRDAAEAGQHAERGGPRLGCIGAVGGVGGPRRGHLR
jgi:hypothetical protein